MIIGIGGFVTNSGSNSTSLGWGASGANTINASSTTSAAVPGTAGGNASRVWVIEFANEGSTTITLYKWVSGGTGSYFSTPNIFAVAL